MKVSLQLDPARQLISQLLLEKFAQLQLEIGTQEQLFLLLTVPPQKEMGDLCFPCFQVAKLLKKAPPIAAQTVVYEWNLPLGLTASVQGPYINFKFSSAWFGENFLNKVLDKTVFSTPLLESAPKTMIEYSQPNTHKELHVGHMRNASLGDALVRMHRYAGYPVVAATFPGDVGTHVAKCLWYLKNVNQEPLPTERQGEWLGKIYSKANLLLEDQLGTPQEAQNREQLTLILKELEAQSGVYYQLWKTTRQWSVDLMNEVYRWCGIEFDVWYWESDVDADSVKFVKELQAQGKLEVSQGAVGLNLEAEKLGFCLLLKSDGNGLYATKDLELARRKFLDHKIEKSVYVVDVRQALHFSQVFKVLEKIGFAQAKNCYHLQYNFVELPDGAMSSRKGNVVPLMTLVESMQFQVKTEFLSRYANEWTPEEIDQCAAQVAQGAIKYGMLKIDTNKKIVFDLKEWLKIDGDSGPFIQYSAARISSLVKKFSSANSAAPNWSLLVKAPEEQLMGQMLQFNSVILKATQSYQPASVCTYLFELAQGFNHFYHECSIGQAETEELKLARLKLAEACGLILRQGLALLGIPSPQRM